MSVTLGGVTLNANLHLLGKESNPPVSYSVRETIGGSVVTQIDPRTAGARLRLIARNDGSSRMGFFCTSHIDSVKSLAQTGNSYTLSHWGSTYTVKILEINVDQSDEREAPGPNKKWHGEIILQEV